MKFAFIVFHYPELDHRFSLLRDMSEMASFFQGIPGFIDAGTWVDETVPDRIVGISLWESRQSFVKSGITLGDPDEIVAGEIRPRERFLLDLQ
jgi:hypothetical protein